LLPGHPRMQQLNADLAGLKKQIVAEVSKFVDGLVKEARVSVDREASIKKRLSELKQTVVIAGPDEARLKMLTSDAKAKRDELERMQTQYNVNKTRADSKAVPVEAKLLAPASPASVPVFPKKMPWAALAALATFILGLAMTILKAAATGARSGGTTPSRGRSTTQPHAETFQPIPATLAPSRMAMAGAATAATVAAVAATASTITAPTAVPSTDHPQPQSDEGDGFTPIATSDALVEHVLAHTPERGGYRTLISGDTDHVDATQVAVSLAVGLAKAGQPVVLIEWSHAEHLVARSFGTVASPGMAELVSGSATFEDVIVSMPGCDGHFIPAGTDLGDVAATLDPDQLNLVLDALDEAYAHIVVVGEYSAARVLFEVIQGRFDAGVMVTDGSQPQPALRDPEGTFLGFEVADIDLLRFEPTHEVESTMPRRLRSFGSGARAQHPAE
jgi:polysaccharide biosynthesis transport protein